MKLRREERGKDYYARRADEVHEVEEEAADDWLSCILSRDRAATMKLGREERGDDYYARRADEGYEAEKEAADNWLSSILSRDQRTCSRASIRKNFRPNKLVQAMTCIA